MVLYFAQIACERVNASSDQEFIKYIEELEGDFHETAFYDAKFYL